MTLNNIYRTITDTRCYGQYVNDHGEFDDFTAAIVGSFDKEKATKVLRKEYADNTIRGSAAVKHWRIGGE